jgi:hypothetical protein
MRLLFDLWGELAKARFAHRGEAIAPFQTVALLDLFPRRNPQNALSQRIHTATLSP